MKEALPIGLIAGNGRFPILIAQAARQAGKRMVAVAHLGETQPELEPWVESLHWIRLGEFGKLVKIFKKEAVSQVILAGGIDKKKMFTRVRPDLKGLLLMARMGQHKDDQILRTVARELTKEGIEVLPSTTLLPSLLAPAGVLTRRRPTEEEERDIDFGWSLAKELGKLDIGQCLVVRKGAVVAVEAMEGTDETIRRGGRLAREKAVVIKICKPIQDLRFDLPAIGEQTIRTMLEVKASVLAIEAQKTILFDQEATLRLADRHRMVIVSRP
jgi:DUF1009 family protein